METCNVCKHLVSELYIEAMYGYELPEPMCDECAQEYLDEMNSKYEGL